MGSVLGVGASTASMSIDEEMNQTISDLMPGMFQSMMDQMSKFQETCKKNDDDDDS